MAQQTPMQNALLVLQLRKHHPPLPLLVVPFGCSPRTWQTLPLAELVLQGLAPTSPNLTYSAGPVTQSKTEMAGLLAKCTAAVLNLGSPGKTQEVLGHRGLHASLWVFMFIVHFPGESIHHFITSSNGSLTRKKLKDCCINLWTENIHNKGQVPLLFEV